MRTILVGLIDVLMRYDVHTVLMTENKNDTPIADTFIKMVAEEGRSSTLCAKWSDV
jgi:hypothetical protein